MANRKREKRKTVISKTLHRKLRIELCCNIWTSLRILGEIRCIGNEISSRCTGDTRRVSCCVVIAETIYLITVCNFDNTRPCGYKIIEHDFITRTPKLHTKNQKMHLFHTVFWLVVFSRTSANKRQRIPKRQSKKDNSEKLAIEGTQD